MPLRSRLDLHQIFQPGAPVGLDVVAEEIPLVGLVEAVAGGFRLPVPGPRQNPDIVQGGGERQGQGLDPSKRDVQSRA